VLRRRQTSALLAARVAARISAFAGEPPPLGPARPADQDGAPGASADGVPGPGGPERDASVGHAR